MDESQIEEFKEAFRVFDTDHGGTIDSDEYGKLMSILGMSSDVERLTEMFVAMDGDEDGELQFEEFLVLMATLMHQESTTDDILDAFETIDVEETGLIPLSIVQHILEGVAENVSYSEVDLLLAEIDSDSDGMVSVLDLKRFMALERIPHRVKIVDGDQDSNKHYKKMIGAEKTTAAAGGGGVEI